MDLRHAHVATLSFLAIGCLVGCAETERIAITSNPSGAEVYADGQYVGETPCIYYFRHVGTKTMTIRKEGYQDQKKVIFDVFGTWEDMVGDLQFSLQPTGDVAPVPASSASVSPAAAGALRPGAAWAVVVGVAQYEASGPGGLNNLSFADADARDFAAALMRLGWGPDNIHLLLNENATKRKVEYAMETWLKRAGPDDLIVLFWSSHGWPDVDEGDRAYFACYDSKLSDPSSAMRMDRVRQMLEERKARNVIVIADTCHSGKVIRSGGAKGVSVVPALEAMEKQQAVPRGWVFVASADPDRSAYEDKAWKNGALTHVLLQGLNGAADGYKSVGIKDGIVTLGELRAYITDQMAEESMSILGAKLLPLFYTTSGNPEIWSLSFHLKQSS